MGEQEGSLGRPAVPEERVTGVRFALWLLGRFLAIVFAAAGYALMGVGVLILLLMYLDWVSQR